MAAKDTHVYSGNRKSPIAIKREDGEPFTREDLQYDLLALLFDDPRPVFTDPNTTLSAQPPGTKVSFRDLYVNTISSSLRNSKQLHDRLTVPRPAPGEDGDAYAYATDFAKVSFLTNVGKINTTMAFCADSRTNIRTYHPIPAFRQHEGNLQDAPRIKNSLKACLLPSENIDDVPSTPAEILTKRLENNVPTTTIVNLIFVMANHGLPIGSAHLEDCDDFLDLFRSHTRVPSAQRAAIILWLFFHYLESPTAPNPYADDYARANPGKAPRMHVAAQAHGEKWAENVDPPEEVEWGRARSVARRASVERHQQEKAQADADAEAGRFVERVPRPKPSIIMRVKLKERGDAKSKAARKKASAAVDAEQRVPPVVGLLDMSLCKARADAVDVYPAPAVVPVEMSSSRATAKHARGRRGNKHPDAPALHRDDSNSNNNNNMMIPAAHAPPPPSPDRTMFQHAWHVVVTTDALIDSDDELGDHHARTDYIRRLGTLKRLRGKSPTPEQNASLSSRQQSVVVMDVDGKMW